MSIKNGIKSILAQNVYTWCLGSYAFNKILKRDDKFNTLIENMGHNDYFEDISYLKNFRKKYNDKILPKGIGNYYIYGISNAVWGQRSVEKIYEMPSVEHGLILYEKAFSDTKTNPRASCITFSKFRKNIIQSKVNIPIFCVGPYIHYSDMFYTKENLDKMKKKLGKTLLVFPMHSTDASVITIDQSLFIKMLRKKAINYDSVLINAYWWNITDPLIDALKSEGYKIISCGWNHDIKFLARLKSYISLSDMVIGDSVGTHIGYCIDCGVPFSYEDINSNVVTTDPNEIKAKTSYEYNQNIIKNAFLCSDSIGEKEIKICDYYWGSSCIKTKEELQKIIEINKDLLHKTHGFRSALYKKSAELLEVYKHTDTIKYKLLLDALPDSFQEDYI